MGDWSNFFKGIGEIVNEVSKAREQYLQNQQNQPEVNVNATTSSVHASNSSRLYPDLESVSNDARQINIQQVSNDSIDVLEDKVRGDVSAKEKSDEQIAKQQRRNRQRRADDEEEWEFVGDRNRNRNRGRGGGSGGSGGGGGALAALGIAGVALGAYAAYKAYCGKEETDEPILVSSQTECINRLKKLERDIEEFPVVGLDCQWLINESPYEPRHPIALLQLATYKGNVILVPLKKFTIPDRLKSILSSSEIIKTGIEVIKDARFLREDYSLTVQSTFDLRFLAEETANRPEGLEKLSKTVLNLDIGRDWDTIKSDWEKWPLEQKQIDYAETAVKASIDIFMQLYQYTAHARTKPEVLRYCSMNMDRPFIWDTRKWD
jgi:hypothetical protein